MCKPLAAAQEKKERKPARPRHDFEALKQRRLRAADMFRRGKSQVRGGTRTRRLARERFEVVRAPGALEAGQPWREREELGRLPRLSDEQLADVVTASNRGPRANGFATEMWTLSRVAEVIEERTGVHYGATRTWTILRDTPGLEPPAPEPGVPSSVTTRPSPPGWRGVGSRKKKGPGAEAPGSSSRTSRVQPPPGGESHLGASGREAPVLHHHFSWTRLSMSASPRYQPTAPKPPCSSRSKTVPTTPTRSSPSSTSSMLTSPGEKVTVILDGLPSHRSKCHEGTGSPPNAPGSSSSSSPATPTTSTRSSSSGAP